MLFHFIESFYIFGHGFQVFHCHVVAGPAQKKNIPTFVTVSILFFCIAMAFDYSGMSCSLVTKDFSIALIFSLQYVNDL